MLEPMSAPAENNAAQSTSAAAQQQQQREVPRGRRPPMSRNLQRQRNRDRAKTELEQTQPKSLLGNLAKMNKVELNTIFSDSKKIRVNFTHLTFACISAMGFWD